MPDYRPRLSGGNGVGELRWFSANKQQRLIGFFWDGVWVALVGCYHKQNIYSPASALETAKRYKTEVERGEARTVEYDL